MRTETEQRNLIQNAVNMEVDLYAIEQIDRFCDSRKEFFLKWTQEFHKFTVEKNIKYVLVVARQGYPPLGLINGFNSEISNTSLLWQVISATRDLDFNMDSNETNNLLRLDIEGNKVFLDHTISSEKTKVGLLNFAKKNDPNNNWYFKDMGEHMPWGFTRFLDHNHFSPILPVTNYKYRQNPSIPILSSNPAHHAYSDYLVTKLFHIGQEAAKTLREKSD